MSSSRSATVRWPVELTGRNSVTPSMTPRTIESAAVRPLVAAAAIHAMAKATTAASSARRTCDRVTSDSVGEPAGRGVEEVAAHRKAPIEKLADRLFAGQDLGQAHLLAGDDREPPFGLDCGRRV